MSLLDRLGLVDNLNEPTPILNTKGAIFGAILSFLIVSSTAACGRLWVRIFVTRTPGWDDLFVLLALLSNIAAGATLCVLGARDGLGQHFLLLGLDGMVRFMRTFYAANAIYPLSTTFIKLALLFQYLRCFDRQAAPRLRLLTQVSIVVISLWGFAYTFVAFFPCQPVHAFWELTTPTDAAVRWGFCSHDITVLVDTYVGHAATNMFLDLVCFALPMTLCLKPGVDKKTRKALVGVFALGSLVNICSIIRLITLVDHQAGTWPTLDPSWYGCTPIVLSALEVNLATICASLPVFWPMIQEKMRLRSIMVTHEIEITRETRHFEDLQFPYEMEANNKSTEAIILPRLSTTMDSGKRKPLMHVEAGLGECDGRELGSSPPGSLGSPAMFKSEEYNMHPTTYTKDGSFPAQKTWMEHQSRGRNNSRAGKIDMDLRKI